MPKIEINKGETERVITPDEANEEYDVEVLRGTVSFGHDKNYARDGTKYTAPKHGTLKRLQGEPMYAYAHSPKAVIEVDGNSFFFDLFGQSETLSPSERGGVAGADSLADAEEKYRVEEMAVDAEVTGGEEQLFDLADSREWQNETQGADYDLTVREVCESLTVTTAPYTPEVRLNVRFTTQDGSAGATYYKIHGAGEVSVTNALDIPLPPDVSINVWADAQNASFTYPVWIKGAANIRREN